MRIAIVGAGAIGGYVGAHMARDGQDVIFVDPWPDHIEVMRRDGLHITGMQSSEAFSVPVQALHVSEVQTLSRNRLIDVAFISVKSYDTEWATALISSYLSPTGFVVSLQNGINEDRIASIVGWGRSLGCIVGVVGAELVAPGVVVRNTPRSGGNRIALHVGEVHGQVTPRAKMVATFLKNAESSDVTTNLWGQRWSKLVINSMRNGVSAFTGLSGKERDLNEATRWLTIRLGSQCIRVAQALGFHLENAGLDTDTLARAGEGDDQAKQLISEQIIRITSVRSEEQRPSMAQDIKKGRRTETDFINGLVARKGAEVGVDANLHARVNELVKKVERGELKASPELAADL